MSFMTNGLRWMHSIADPKQHAQTLDNVLGASEHNGRQAGAVPVMEPAPRVGASPTIHGNGRPPVVPDGPPRRYGGWHPSEMRRVGKKGQRGGGASGGRRPSSPFRVILPSAVREPSRSVRREVRMPASSKTIVRGWGAVLGLEDVRKAYDARRRSSFRGRLLSVVSVALVVSGLVVVSVPVMLQSWSAGNSPPRPVVWRRRSRTGRISGRRTN